jgi:two-component system, cell cycle sensor histidine kinase and response regulator CckA
LLPAKLSFDASANLSKKHTILFVEDDEAFRYAACRHLQAKGYSVIGVPSSIDALRAIEEHGVDLVITDVTLNPNEPHGVALALLLRSKHPGVQILFVTGMMDLEQRDPELAGQVLYKPVELADLSRKVGELLA